MLEKLAGMLRKCIIRPQFVVLLCWICVLLLGAAKELLSIPETYLSSKRNLLNVYFVKWAWAWTLSATFPYAVITAFVYGCDKWKKYVIFAALRIAFVTSLWYFWTTMVFISIENVTGVCMNPDGDPVLEIEDKVSCKALGKGHIFVGFDISGHTFNLTFALLVISSESQIQKHWLGIPVNSAQFLTIGSKSLSRTKTYFQKLNNITVIFFIYSCFLSIIWSIMLVSTCVYFHTFISKAIGAAAAILSWMLLYNELYPRIKMLPGEGPLRKILLGLLEKCS